MSECECVYIHNLKMLLDDEVLEEREVGVSCIVHFACSPGVHALHHAAVCDEREGWQVGFVGNPRVMLKVVEPNVGLPHFLISLTSFRKSVVS